MPTTSRERWLLVFPVAFNLWVLRAEARVVENLNDGSLHAAMIRTAAGSWRSLRIPLDVWFPFLSLGSANFHQYQSLPHILAGLPAALIGGDRVYSWSLYVLLALWPLAVYMGARLLEWDVPASLGAAFVASLVASRPGYGFEWISYTFGGLGVWTQLWGMWLLPLSLGLSWQAVERRRHIVPAAIVLAITIVSHVITGYFAALAVVVFIVVGWERSRWLRRAVTGAALGAAAAVGTAWLMVPFLTDRAWAAGGTFTQGFWRDSFGARQVFGWLVTGNLFDRAFMPPKIRVPVITVLVFLGVVRCVLSFGRDVRARALLAMFVVALVLFSGRPTFGFAINLLPGSGSLLLHRYILAVHMTGVLLAGVGAAWLLDPLRRFAHSAIPRHGVAAGVLTFVVALALLPAWRERAHFATWSGNLVRGQAKAQAADRGNRAGLIDLAKRRGGGRIHAGLRNNWGANYKVGYVWGLTSLLNHGADGVGFTFRVASMFTDAEAYLDDKNAAQLDAFAVRYLLMPRTLKPSVPATLVRTSGDHALWEIPHTGYVSVVDTIEPIRIRDQLHASTVQTAFLKSSELRKGLYPTVAYLAKPAAKPTATAAHPPRGSPGSVTPVDYAPTRGLFRARVTATRTAAVMLKSSYHGRWRVRVDGRTARKYMVAPGFPAVTVDAGTHDVEYRYIPVGSYPWLFLLALAAFLLLYALVDPRGWLRGARAEERDLTDDRRDRAVLLANTGALHGDEKEQQQEADIEGEIDTASDAEVLGDDGGEVGHEHGDDEPGHQHDNDKPVPPG